MRRIALWLCIGILGLALSSCTWFTSTPDNEGQSVPSSLEYPYPYVTP